jgi:hypothetical protein
MQADNEDASNEQSDRHGPAVVLKHPSAEQRKCDPAGKDFKHDYGDAFAIESMLMMPKGEGRHPAGLAVHT